MIIQVEYAITQERSMNTTEQSLISAAEQAVIAKFPDFKAEGKKPVLRDMGDHWEFTYELPPTMLGGAPVVIIDKRTKSISHIYRTQQRLTLRSVIGPAKYAELSATQRKARCATR